MWSSITATWGAFSAFFKIARKGRDALRDPASEASAGFAADRILVSMLALGWLAKISVRAEDDSLVAEFTEDGLSTGEKTLVLPEIATPGLIADTGRLYAKEVGGATELHYLDDSGNEVQLTDAGAIAGLGAIGALSGTSNSRFVINDGVVAGGDVDGGLTIQSADAGGESNSLFKGYLTLDCTGGSTARLRYTSDDDAVERSPIFALGAANTTLKDVTLELNAGSGASARQGLLFMNGATGVLQVSGAGGTEISLFAATTFIVKQASTLFSIDPTGDGVAAFNVRLNSAGRGLGVRNLSVVGPTPANPTDDLVFLDGTANNVDYALPAVGGNSGRRIIVKRIDATVNVVQVSAADLVDGGASVPLAASASKTFVSNGTTWYSL